MNSNLQTALSDLVEAIQGVTLGSVEYVVIVDAGKALISNWNDHNPDDPIDEVTELQRWRQRHN